MPLTESRSQGRLVDVGDTRLFVVERSVEGPPLILLHGGPGLDHWSFADYLDPLVPDVHLVLVDQRAHGMSERPPRETWTIERMARDVADLAAALELRSYSVLGHFFGGFVALRLAVERPAGLDRLVLANTVPSVRWLEGLDARIDALEPPELRERVRWGWDHEGGSPEQFRQAVEAQMPFHFADVEDERIGEYLRRSAGGVPSPEVAEHFSATGYDAFDVEAALGEIDAETLLLTGRHERTCEPGASELMAERIPDAQLVVFERSAHMPFVEEHEAFVETVRRFVATPV